MANLLLTIYSFLPSSDSNEFDFYSNKIYMFFMVFWVTDYKSVYEIARLICLKHFFKQIILKNYRLSTRCICFSWVLGPLSTNLASDLQYYCVQIIFKSIGFSRTHVHIQISIDNRS